MHPLIEMCAKACEAMNDGVPIVDGPASYAAAFADGYEMAIDTAAAAIRALPQAEIDGAGEAVAWTTQLALDCAKDGVFAFEVCPANIWGDKGIPLYAAPAALPEGLADTIIAGIIKDIRDRQGIGDEWENIDVDVRNEIAQSWREIIAAAQGEQK